MIDLDSSCSPLMTLPELCLNGYKPSIKKEMKINTVSSCTFRLLTMDLIGVVDVLNKKKAPHSASLFINLTCRSEITCQHLSILERGAHSPLK